MSRPTLNSAMSSILILSPSSIKSFPVVTNNAFATSTLFWLITFPFALRTKSNLASNFPVLIISVSDLNSSRLSLVNSLLIVIFFASISIPRSALICPFKSYSPPTVIRMSRPLTTPNPVSNFNALISVISLLFNSPLLITLSPTTTTFPSPPTVACLPLFSTVFPVSTTSPSVDPMDDLPLSDTFSTVSACMTIPFPVMSLSVLLASFWATTTNCPLDNTTPLFWFLTDPNSLPKYTLLFPTIIPPSFVTSCDPKILSVERPVRIPLLLTLPPLFTDNSPTDATSPALSNCPAFKLTRLSELNFPLVSFLIVSLRLIAN